MRRVAGKIHLLDRDDPLITPLGVLEIVNCNEMVIDPEIAFIWDEVTIGEPLQRLSSLKVCRKCANIGSDKRYVYGIQGKR